MKTISIYFLIIAIFFTVSSCKKESKKETEKDLNFYSAPANSEDKVVFTSSDLNKSNQIMAYGIFGSNGLHASINSLVFGDRGREYFGNLILDSSKRPKLFYLIKKSGIKDNVVLSFTYPTSNTVVYNLYYYDWDLKRDSLLQQQKININDFSSTITYSKAVMESSGSGVVSDISYWNSVSSELKNIRNNIESVFNEKVVIKSASETRFNTGYVTDFMSGYKGGGLNTYFALVITQLKAKEEQAKEIASWSSPVKLDEFKPGVNSEFSTLASVGSPTSGLIPNPTGTPSEPVSFPIKLTLNGLAKSGMYNGNEQCYGGPLNVYYLNFAFNDNNNKVKTDLSNLKITIAFEKNGCFGVWDTSSNGQSYFANYPITFNNSTIKVPTVVSLGAANSNWAKISAYFVDINTGNQISNQIKFDVQRGVNYP